MKFIFLILAVALISASCARQYPLVAIETELGDILVELYDDKAPLTVRNFISYIEEERLNEATFYRIVTLHNQPDSKIKIEVIQGGLFEDDHPDALPPITHETTLLTGIKHLDGIISMARNEPGTATCEFFICIGDQPSLDFGGMRNPDGQGFAAFGKVVEGMDVVQKIHRASSNGQWLEPKIVINKFTIIN